jgi:CBS domain-containing protein
MTTVHSVLQLKGSNVWSITPETSVFQALKVMAEKNVGALLVMEGKKICGIFSERDYARKIILRGESSQHTVVKEAMTSMVMFVRPEQSIEECMALMTEKHIRHLPVLDHETVVGVISIGDVVKAMISEREYTIRQLENYITGSR